MPKSEFLEVAREFWARNMKYSTRMSVEQVEEFAAEFAELAVRATMDIPSEARLDPSTAECYRIAASRMSEEIGKD